jgi:uncharacterized protein
MFRFLGYAISAGALIYLAAGVTLFFNQRSLLFPRPQLAMEPWIPGASVIRIETPGEDAVFAIHLPARPGQPTIAHFHGNGEQLAGMAALAEAQHAAGFGFFAVEYPGYGLAHNGRPSKRSIFKAADTALRYLRDQLSVPKERTILQGQSLGSAVAAAMTARGFGAKLVLISPYTSMADLGQHAYPLFPVRLLVLDRFDTAALAPKISIPVLIVTGAEDEIVPSEMGERLSRLFPNARFRRLAGRHHNDILGEPALFDEIFEFIQNVDRGVTN